MNFKRVQTKKQIELAAALAKAIWMEHYPSILPEGQTEYMVEKFQSADAIERQIDLGHHYHFILYDEKPVGYLDFVLKDDVCFISKIYIHKTARGKGLGKSALSFIESHAKTLSAKKLQLTVNKNNIQAINAYLRADFQNVGPTQMDIGNGFLMDDYKMEKGL